ncbi:hypothetical protein V3C99_015402, partial [Haemonchus contortus]
MIIGKDPREENGKGDRLARKNKVMVAERRYIPPRETALVNVVCEGERDAVTERVIWSCKQGVEAGLYSIKDQKTVLPVFNKSDQPMVLKMGEEVGYWNTDKWHERWEDFNQLMSSEKGNKMTQPERRRLLEELITKNMETSSIDNDVRKLLNGYEEVFAVSDEELCQTNLVHMSIDTGDSPPIRMKARPVPLGVRPKLRELLLDLVRRKVIEPSKSDWAFPIVLVEKKDGSIRLCVDYRELNKKIKLDAYPLPNIEAVLQSLAGKQFFSTLDLCSGYWQIPLADDAKEKSAFATPEGLYQFRV